MPAAEQDVLTAAETDQFALRIQLRRHRHSLDLALAGFNISPHFLDGGRKQLFRLKRAAPVWIEERSFHVNAEHPRFPV